MLSLDKGIMVNNGYSIVDMDILINNFTGVYLFNIDSSDVDTVRAIITMTIVYFSGSQWNP
jgi:hypothetical protein